MESSPNICERFLTKAKELGSEGADFVPGAGHIKMLIEAIMGRTFQGLELTVFERFCYFSTIPFSLYTYYTTVHAPFGETPAQDLSTGAVAGFGYWLAFLSGKARGLGKALSFEMLRDEFVAAGCQKAEKMKGRLEAVRGFWRFGGNTSGE